MSDLLLRMCLAMAGSSSWKQALLLSRRIFGFSFHQQLFETVQNRLSLSTRVQGAQRNVETVAARVGNRSLLTPPVQELIVWGRGCFALTNMSAFGHESLSFLLHSRILSKAFIELLFLCCFHTRGPFWWPWSLSHSSCGPPHSFFKFLGLSSVHLLHAWQRLRWWSIWNKS